MENTESCEIKVVDYKTKYIAIGAYDYNCEDEGVKSEELNCEYAIIKADDNLLEVLNEIKKFNLRLIAGNLCDRGLIELIDTEFLLFDCSISFFGDNPDLENRTNLYKSTLPLKDRGNILNLEDVEGNFDDEIGNLRETLGKYEKCHVRLSSGERSPSALYCPVYSEIVFRCQPDSYTDYRTFPVNIDKLIDFITND